MGLEDPPSFVYGIIVPWFVVFNTFSVSLMLEYKKVGSWEDCLSTSLCSAPPAGCGSGGRSC
ncbi:MAG: hypothetical protein GXY46_07850 [Actinobacteria bacterium]|nr:hypothetical protein [Actinomycetota bacterium]